MTDLNHTVREQAQVIRDLAAQGLNLYADLEDRTAERDQARSIAVTLEQQLAEVVATVIREAHVARDDYRDLKRDSASESVLWTARCELNNLTHLACTVILSTGQAETRDEAERVLWETP